MQQPVTATEIIVISLLGVWLLANIAYAVFNRRIGRVTYHRDVFRWLSAYQMFSATSSDYRLLYRDQLADNSLTGWTAIPLTPAWKPWHLAWYPQKQVPLAVYSMVDDVAEGLEQRKERVATGTISERFMYRMLLQYVRRFQAPAGATGRQFLIEKVIAGAGDPEYREVFISNLHPHA